MSPTRLLGEWGAQPAPPMVQPERRGPTTSHQPKSLTSVTEEFRLLKLITGTLEGATHSPALLPN